MDEEELRAFVAIVQHYFEQTSRLGAQVGSPYLTDLEQLPIFDYTGVIGISGPRRGCIYFTAPTGMLRNLLLSLGEIDCTDENFGDLVGEVANTISGNARKTFGPEFGISVPVVIKGANQTIKVPRAIKSYVIPMHWQRDEAALVVGLA
jgi:chemotaxis protein CheX